MQCFRSEICLVLVLLALMSWPLFLLGARVILFSARRIVETITRIRKKEIPIPPNNIREATLRVLPGEQSIKTHHISVSFGLRPPICKLYRLHYVHISVYPFFNSVLGRGSVFTAEERRQCIAIVYDDILRNALLVERASKHYGSVHTFRRSTFPVGLVGVVGEFPDTCVATELMHGLRRKFPYDSPCSVACFQVCVLPYEPRLAALHWLKASHRLEWEDRGLGAVRKSVQDERENLPPNSDTRESEPEHNRLFERPREVLMHRAGETITDGRRR